MSAGAAIAAGAQIIGGLFSGRAAKRASEDDWAKTKWMLDYNTPINQMKRLKEAGLNPALMYGSGATAATTGNASQSQPKANISDGAAGLMGAIPALMDIMMMDKKIELIDKTIEQKSQDIVTSDTKNRFTEYQMTHVLPQSIRESQARQASTEWNMSRSASLLPSELQGKQLDNDKRAQEIENLKAQYDGTILDNTAKEIQNSYLNEREAIALVDALYSAQGKLLNNKLTGQNVTSAMIKNAVDLEFLGLSKRGVLKDDNVFARMGALLITRLEEYFKN